MNRFLLILLIVISTFYNISAQQDSRAVQILEETRRALGGEKLKTVQNLTAKGKLAENIEADQSKTGSFEMTIELPDKFMKSETKIGFGNNEVTEIQTLNGIDEWFDIKSSGASGDNLMAVKPSGETANSFGIRQMATRIFLGLFAAPPASVAVEYSYAGTAQSSEKEEADVLDIKGENFNARLFIDRQTHLPLMITYKSAPAVRPASKQMTVKKLDLSKIEPRTDALKTLDYQLTFEDFRDIEGLKLPFRMTESVSEKVVKEWNFTSYKLNASIKTKSFVKSE